MCSGQPSSESLRRRLPPAAPNLSSPRAEWVLCFYCCFSLTSQPLFILGYFPSTSFEIHPIKSPCLRGVKVYLMLSSTSLSAHLLRQPGCSCPGRLCLLWPQGPYTCCLLPVSRHLFPDCSPGKVCFVFGSQLNWPFQGSGLWPPSQSQSLLVYALCLSSLGFPSLHASQLILKHSFVWFLGLFQYTPPCSLVVSKVEYTTWSNESWEDKMRIPADIYSDLKM